MITMEQSISSLQLEVRSINKRVEQTHLDLQECLRVHHPGNSDDEDNARGCLSFPLFYCLFLCILRVFVIFCYFVKHLNLYYSVFSGPSETVRGSNFYYNWFLLLCFTFCPFVTKKGEKFLFLDRECISKPVK